MSDCGVCLDYSDVGSCDFSSISTVTARKQHRCCECGETIAPKQQYEITSGRYEGEFYSCKTCLSCAAIRKAFTCGVQLLECFWEDMQEYVFPELTLSSECLKQLSASDRARVIDKWRQWKGLR